MNLYGRKEWFAYRAECIANADGVCKKCGRGSLENAILQVHHPTYIDGRKPWEYPAAFCEVLCRGCHAEKHGIILPRSGWNVICSDLDRNEPSDPVPCANCTREVQWHVTIYHPAWGEAIVGSECGDKLSLGAELSALKSYNRRMNAFIASPRWKPTPKGSSIRQDGLKILVFERDGAYRVKIGDRWGEISFQTSSGAKQRVFEFVEGRRRRRLKNKV